MKKVSLIFTMLVAGFLFTSCNSDNDLAYDLYGYGIIGAEEYNSGIATSCMLVMQGAQGDLNISVAPSLIGLELKNAAGEVRYLVEGDLVFGQYKITETMTSGPVKHKTKLYGIAIPNVQRNPQIYGLDTLGTTGINIIQDAMFFKNFLFTGFQFPRSNSSKHSFALAVDSVWNEGEYNYFRNDSLFLEIRHKATDLTSANSPTEVIILTDFAGFNLPSEDSITISLSYRNAAGDKVQYKPSKPIKFMPFER